jgi:hypothetical protein
MSVTKSVLFGCNGMQPGMVKRHKSTVIAFVYIDVCEGLFCFVVYPRLGTSPSVIRFVLLSVVRKS